MAKDYEMEYFYDADKHLDRAFTDTVGQISAMKLGLTPKKPDRAKLKDILAKNKRPTGPAKGAFFLSLNGFKLTFEVRVATVKIVLNTLDIGAVKDLAKKRDLLHQLNVRSHLVSDQDLAAFDKQNADPEDSDAAVKLNTQIDKLKNEIDNRQITLGAANYKGKEYSEYSSEFRDWIQPTGFNMFKAFVDDVQNGRGLSEEGRKLLDNPNSGIKPATLKAIKAAADKGEAADFTQARKEVIALINKSLLPRFNKEKIEEHTKRIKEAKAEMAKLQKQLKDLKAD